ERARDAADGGRRAARGEHQHQREGLAERRAPDARGPARSLRPVMSRFARPHHALAAAAVLAVASPAAADFDSCVARLRAGAGAKGVSPTTFDRVMSGVTPDPKVVEAMESQPEFKTPIWDYMAFLVDQKRIDDGKQMMARHAAALSSAE